MTNFFNNNDLIIVVDDEILPNDKEKAKFTDLPENIIKSVANSLELVEDEYDGLTLSSINEKLSALGRNLDDFIKYDINEEFKPAKVFKYHPSDAPKGTITEKIKELGAKRNFIVLDKFLEKDKNLNLLSQYLSELCEIMPDYYIGIVFYSSDPNPIESLKEAEDFLKVVGLKEEEIEKLSMHVNFVDKSSKHKLMCFETAFRRCQNNNLISLYSESYYQTIMELKEKIWDINNNEALIHYDYLMEGMQLDDIFYEIYQSRFNQIYNKKCFEKYDEYINPVRKSIQTYESDKNLDKEEEIRKRIFISRSVKEINNLLKQETYLYKCKKSDDIRFGDILKLNNSYYMVVTQDCDLSIRLLGGRKSDFITLIRVDYSNANLTNDSIKNKLINNYKKTFEGSAKNFDKSVLTSNISSFKKLDIDETTINNIFNKDKKNQCKFECEEINVKLNKNYKLYHIESIFLDCIILNNQNIKKIEITKENISNSNEIRLATKRYIDKNFNEFIDKYSRLQYQSLKEISDQKLISDLIPIDFIFDDSHKLIGFSIEKDKIERIGRVDYIKAYDIFKEFMSKYSRISYNNPPLI